MRTIHGHVIVGKLAKSFPADKGFKGLLQLNEQLSIGVYYPYDGNLKEELNKLVGKQVALVGDLVFPGQDQKIPVLTVRGTLQPAGHLVKRGRLTKDPELKYTPQGKALTQFSIAVNRGFGDKQTSYFINCTVFGNDNEKNAATILAENCAKGQEIIVRGRLSASKGNDKTFYNMVVDEYEFIYSNGKGKSSKGDDDPYAEFADVGIVIDDVDDDIPF